MPPPILNPPIVPLFTLITGFIIHLCRLRNVGTMALSSNALTVTVVANTSNLDNAGNNTENHAEEFERFETCIDILEYPVFQGMNSTIGIPSCQIDHEDLPSLSSIEGIEATGQTERSPSGVVGVTDNSKSTSQGEGTHN